MKPFISYSLLLLAVTTHAANVTQIARYSTVKNEALAAQMNPLKSIQRIHFPASIHTIGESVQYWLIYSGYHLAPKEKLSSPLQQVFQQPLPQVNRTLGPLSIEDGLTVLVGKHLFNINQDDLLREINFNLIARKKV
jgi:conjugative transfer region protein (TIGR03748 family)